MAFYDDDRHYYEQEEAMERFLEDSLKQIQEENVCSYLGCYGDAVQERIDAALSDAESLLDAGFNGPSLVASVSAIELIIRFLLLRPLVHGAFLSDEWAAVLVERVAGSRTAEDRELLPKVLRARGIELAQIRSPSGVHLWEHTLKVIWPRRNNVVHKAERPSQESARDALECARAFLRQVMSPVAVALGFTLEKTGKWARTNHSEPGTPRLGGASYTPSSPF